MKIINEKLLKIKIKCADKANEILIDTYKSQVSKNRIRFVEQSIEEPSNTMINIIKDVLNSRFDASTIQNQKKSLESFKTEMCKYLQLDNANLFFDYASLCVNNMHKQLLQGAYKQDEINEKVMDFIDPQYGQTCNQGDMELSLYGKSYIKKLNETLGIKSSEFQKYIRISYLSTIRHECQHLKQYAIGNRYFKNGTATEYEKAMSLLDLMLISLRVHRLNNKLPSTTYDDFIYTFDLMENDAYMSEVEFLLQLLERQDIIPSQKKYIKKYLLSYIKILFIEVEDNFFEIFKTFIKMTQYKFTKTFGYLPLGKEILNKFNELDINGIIAEIEMKYSEMRDVYNKLEKELNDEKIERKKALSKEQKMRMYENIVKDYGM